MRRNFFILLLVVIAGSFFIFSRLQAASSDIVITEIGAYESFNQEWIEVFNKGMSPIDLKDWKFFDTTMGTTTANHSLKVVTTTDSVLMPGEYGIIAQSAAYILSTYPWVTSSVFEASWGSLNEKNGEEIGLIDAGGMRVEDFTYIPASNHSLERKNVFLNDYTSANWFEHPASNTIGMINWATIAPTSTPTSTSPLWFQIKINEIMPDPDSGDEWVEIYNSATSSVDLTGGSLCDNRMGSCTIAFSSGTIAAQSWLVISVGGNKLNNLGDSVILKSPDGTVVDQVIYSGSLIPKTNQTLARKSDGVDSDNDAADWSVTLTPTPGMANTITVPVTSPPPNTGSGSNPPSPSPSGVPPSPNLPKIPTVSTNPASAVFLNEILPNPEGSDTKDEFVELKNQTSQEVSVQGWKLVVGSKYYQLSGTVLPNQFLILPVTLTKISLRNGGGDEVLLYATNDVLVDRAGYGSAPTGKSFSRADDGKWSWSKTITKGSSNVIALDEEEKKNETETSENGITLNISVPKTAEVGKELVFDARKTTDKKGGVLNFIWNFSDVSSTWSGAEIRRSFLNEGKISGTVTATSTRGSTGKKNFSLMITPAEAHDTGEIKISEVLANPEGADKDEFIELFNPLDREVNLNGWQIKLKSGKKFVIEDVNIQSDEYIVLKQGDTKLSLNNTEEVVTLLDADEKTIDSVKVVKSPEGKSYSEINSKWEFVDPTPGEVNKRSGLTNEDKIEIKNQASGSKTSATSKVLGDYQLATISEVRPMLKGTQVIVQGIVASKPGAVGAKTFYIIDEERGMAVYAGRQNLPNVKIGDRVEVHAALSSAYGAPRLTAHAITVLKSGEEVEPVPLEDEVGEEFAGQLISLQGEVTKSEAAKAYVETDAGEAVVAIKKSAGLKKADFVVGNQIALMGIVEQAKEGEWQVIPRGKEDVEIVGESGKVEDSGEKERVENKTKIEANEEGSLSSTSKYVEMGASGAIGALLVRILSTERMVMMFGGLKKLVVKKEDEDELV